MTGLEIPLKMESGIMCVFPEKEEKVFFSWTIVVLFMDFLEYPCLIST